VRRQNFLALILHSEMFPSRCLKFRYSKTRYQQPQHPTVPLARYYTGPRLPPPGYPPPEDNPPPPYSEAPPPPYQASGYHSGTPHPPSPGYNPPPADHPPADHPPAYPGPGPHTGAPTRRHNAWDCRAVECIGLANITYGFFLQRGMGYVIGYGLWCPNPCPPSWWTKKVGLWGFRHLAVHNARNPDQFISDWCCRIFRRDFVLPR